MNKTFFVETTEKLNSFDHLILRNLYTPLVGKEAIIVYETLVDHIELSNFGSIPFILSEFLKVVDQTLLEFELARKKLEAVGLIRTFERADEFQKIFKINKPLSVPQLKRNSFLYKGVVAKVGEDFIERVEFATRSKQFSKEEYSEVSAKYTDMFEVKTSIQEESSTLEMNVGTFENIEDAIKGAPFSQFVFMLVGTRISPSLMSICNVLRNKGLSSWSLNTIIKYSFDVNGKLVNNHIKTIADDLINREITLASDIKLELASARNNKVSSIVPTDEIEGKVEEASLEDWNDLFGSVGGSF